MDEILTHGFWIDGKTRLAGLVLAALSILLILSAPGFADLDPAPEACMSGHHEAGCCMGGASDLAAETQTPNAPHSECDDATCAMMVSCTPAMTMLTPDHRVEAKRMLGADHTRRRAVALRTVSLDGLKRPPRT
ncbi:hypothetical protein [Maricaulis sp. CAU 1757]